MSTVAKIIIFVMCCVFVLGFSVMNPANNKKAPVGFITPKMKDDRSTEQRWKDAYEWQKNRKK